MTTSTLKILSIQSHVVHGYVGNRAATFPLQYKGWDVDALNTVNYSNHPGYGKFTGDKLASKSLEDIFEKGLCSLGLDGEYDALLTGYTPDSSCLSISAKIGSRICSNRTKRVIWVLDPVLGDNGKLYVSEDIPPVYRSILSSGFVTLTTPNQFEIELLTGEKIYDLQSLERCLRVFHETYKVPNVVISSIQLPDVDDFIFSVGSSCNSHHEPKIFYYKIPKINSSFSGCGDLFSALLTDSYYRQLTANTESSFDNVYLDNNTTTKLPLVEALGEALTAVAKVLRISFEEEKTLLEQRGVKPFEPSSIKDLRIIQARSVFDSNANDYKVRFLESNQ